MAAYLLAALLLCLALCGKTSAQAPGDVLGNCQCNYSSTTAGRHVEGCNSSHICTVTSGPRNDGPFSPRATHLGCLIQHLPRQPSNPHSKVDVYQTCILQDFDFALFCNPMNRLDLSAHGEFDDYVVKVNAVNPYEVTICCYTSLCNDLSVLYNILPLALPSTEEATTATTRRTATTKTPTTMRVVATDANSITNVTPPLYAVVAIPVLSVLLILVVVVIVVVLCLHHYLRPRSSTSSGVPTITSRDSSSCGEQSLNDPDYSGSGAGKPLLTMLSIAGQISLHELIGKGRYGEVWKGLYKCDEVAVKIFHTMDEESWAHEVNIYKTCLFRHPNILRFIASDNRDISYKIELWLITEFCEFGSLYDLLVQRSLEPATMLHLTYTASCGLDHLHTEIFGQEAKPAIVHRDLKSRNILVKADFTCCIGDLGLALRYDRAADQVEDPPSKRVGTKRYLAPEIIDESISSKHFESFKRADIYSFGLILWEIAMRGEVDGVAEEYQMPYQNLVPTDPSFEDMRKTVVVDKRRPTLPNRWTQSELFRGMSNLIQQCWLHDSEARLTSFRLKKSLYNLQKSWISEKKKDKEISS